MLFGGFENCHWAFAFGGEYKVGSATEPGGNDVLVVQLGRDFGGECAKQRHVGADDQVVSGVFRFDFVGFLGKDVGEEYDPAVWVVGDERNQFPHDDNRLGVLD